MLLSGHLDVFILKFPWTIQVGSLVSPPNCAELRGGVPPRHKTFGAVSKQRVSRMSGPQVRMVLEAPGVLELRLGAHLHHTELKQRRKRREFQSWAGREGGD